jgi:hypothetical protein
MIFAERVALLELLLQPDVLLAQHAHEQTLSRRTSSCAIENGLVMKSAALAHGLDRALHRAVGGDDDTVCLGLQGLDAAQQLHALQAGHDEVGEHQVVTVLLEQREPLDAVLGDVDRPALLAQGVGHGDPQQRLVLDDEQPLAADVMYDTSPRGASSPAGSTTRNTNPPPRL